MRCRRACGGASVGGKEFSSSYIVCLIPSVCLLPSNTCCYWINACVSHTYLIASWHGVREHPAECNGVCVLCVGLGTKRDLFVELGNIRGKCHVLLRTKKENAQVDFMALEGLT